ncbi:MAG: amidoligase family protein [Thiohalobacterales bacterium]|nr:amidoligase family protein [Thiohalobacterales bacterium]
MTTSHHRFELPPTVHKEDGNTRSVGFELEFSGISLDETAAAIQSAMGLELRSETAAERILHNEPFGEFSVELDWDYLKRKAAENDNQDEGEEWIERLSQAAAMLVPVEVVCPPIPLTDLSILDPMVVALRKAGAIGTEESLLSAYGVHVNPELPDLDAESVFSYLRAYCLLQWWLVDAHEVDPTRRLSPYIDLYPEAYLKRVLSRDASSMDAIFEDYLEHNATRNRALDLLPLLSEIDEDRVRLAVDDPRIKSRPTFHYRLPNCHIEKAGWSLSESWNTWCTVEKLAGRKADIDGLAAEFLESDRPFLGISRSDWVEFMGQWLTDHGLV